MKGYHEYAAKVDRIAADIEDLEYRAKEDLIKEIVLSNLRVSPDSAAVIVKNIFDILQAGTVYHREWPHAYKLLTKSLAKDADIKEPVPRLQQEIPKLKAFWPQIQKIVYSDAIEKAPTEPTPY